MPGVRIKCFPWAKALLIAPKWSVGLAMKKSVIGIDEPTAGARVLIDEPQKFVSDEARVWQRDVRVRTKGQAAQTLVISWLNRNSSVTCVHSVLKQKAIVKLRRATAA
jgi:hypothetical protein